MFVAILKATQLKLISSVRRNFKPDIVFSVDEANNNNNNNINNNSYVRNSGHNWVFKFLIERDVTTFYNRSSSGFIQEKYVKCLTCSKLKSKYLKRYQYLHYKDG
jgi:hypothetical protein